MGLPTPPSGGASEVETPLPESTKEDVKDLEMEPEFQAEKPEIISQQTEQQEMEGIPSPSSTPPPRPFTPDVLIIEHGNISGKRTKSILKQKSPEKLQTPDVTQVIERDVSMMDLPQQSAQIENQQEEIIIADQPEEAENQGQIEIKESEKEKIKPSSPERGFLKSFTPSPPDSFYNPQVQGTSIPTSVSAMNQREIGFQTFPFQGSQNEFQQQQEPVPQSSFLSQRLPKMDLSQYINPNRGNMIPPQRRLIPWNSQFTPPPVQRLVSIDPHREAALYHPAVRPIKSIINPSLLDTLLPPMGSLRDVPLTPSPPQSITPPQEKQDETQQKEDQTRSLSGENPTGVEGIRKISSPLEARQQNIETEKEVPRQNLPEIQKQPEKEVVEKEKSKPQGEDFQRTKPLKRPDPPSPGVPSMSTRREQMIHPHVKRLDDHPSPKATPTKEENLNKNDSATLEEDDQVMEAGMKTPPQQNTLAADLQGVGQNQQEQMEQGEVAQPIKRPHPVTPLKPEKGAQDPSTPLSLAPPVKRPMAAKKTDKQETTAQKSEEPFSQTQTTGSRHSSRQSKAPSRLEYNADFVQTSTGRQAKQQKIPQATVSKDAKTQAKAEKAQETATTKETKATIQSKTNEKPKNQQQQPETEQTARPKRQVKKPDRFGF